MYQERMTIRILPQLKEQLRQEAARRGDSLNGTIIWLILTGLKTSHNCAAERSKKQ